MLISRLMRPPRMAQDRPMSEKHDEPQEQLGEVPTKTSEELEAERRRRLIDLAVSYQILNQRVDVVLRKIRNRKNNGGTN